MAKSKTAKIVPSKDAPRLNINAKCGVCDHFDRSPYYGSSCKDLGIKKFASPCKAFKSSPLSIDFKESLSGVHLARLMRNVKDKDLPALASIINMEHITRKYGFHFGQPVFIKIFQKGTHLNHYASGIVVSANSKKVFIQGTKGSGFRAEVMHDSVVTVDKFKKIRSKLIRAGKLTCPIAANVIGMETQKIDPIIQNIGTIKYIEPSQGQIEGNIPLQELEGASSKSKRKGSKHDGDKVVLLSGNSNKTKRKPRSKAKPKTKRKLKAAS